MLRDENAKLGKKFAEKAVMCWRIRRWDPRRWTVIYRSKARPSASVQWLTTRKIENTFLHEASVDTVLLKQTVGERHKTKMGLWQHPAEIQSNTWSSFSRDILSGSPAVLWISTCHSDEWALCVFLQNPQHSGSKKQSVNEILSKALLSRVRSYFSRDFWNNEFTGDFKFERFHFQIVLQLGSKFKNGNAEARTILH